MPKEFNEERFNVWMTKVDLACQQLYGLSIYDLPDCCYRDWFEDGKSPKSAARAARRNAMSGE